MAASRGAAPRRPPPMPAGDAGVPADRLADFVTAARDPVTFARRWVTVRHPVRGAVPFAPWPYQVEFLRAMHRHRWTIATMGRQMGKTTTVVAYMLWYTLFTPDAHVLIAAHKQVGAVDVMNRWRFAFEHLPEWMRPQPVVWNRLTVELSNGARIEARATTEDAGRGASIGLLYLDEFAFVRDSIAREFWASVQPTLATGGSCVITSTPQTVDDLFAELWLGATDLHTPDGRRRPDDVGRNGFRALFFPWWHHPERDEAWAEEQRRKIGEERFRREHECRFGGAEDSLIPGAVLEALSPVEAVQVQEDDIYWFDTPPPDADVWVALDPAAGVGDDAAAVVAFAAYDGRLVQLAEWARADVGIPGQVSALRRVLARAAELCPQGERYWTIERNGLGEAAIQSVLEIGEDAFDGWFVHEPVPTALRRRTLASGRRRLGLVTTAARKAAACMRLRHLVETGRMTPRGPRLIAELRNFVRRGDGFGARRGMHDDLVSATLLVMRMLEIRARDDADVRGAFGQHDGTTEDDDLYLPRIETGVPDPVHDWLDELEAESPSA